MSLNIINFYQYKPKLPFRFKTDWFVGDALNYIQQEILTYCVTNITLPKMEVDNTAGFSFFGNAFISMPTFNPGSRKLDITFEETNYLTISRFLDSLLEKSYSKRPYYITIAITEYNEHFTKENIRTGYICHLSSYDELAFKREGLAQPLTITASFIVDTVIENFKDEDAVAGERFKTGGGAFNNIPNNLIIEKQKDFMFGKFAIDCTHTTVQWQAYKNVITKGNITIIDLTVSDKEWLGFNSEGIDIDAVRKKHGKQSVTLVMHKVGYRSRGSISEDMAAQNINDKGVAAFVGGGKSILSLDRMFTNRSVSSKTGSAPNAMSIELLDKTLIGNVGAVVKKDGKWYANIDSGVLIPGSGKSKAQWVELTKKDLDEFAEAVGVSDINQAFEKADASDDGVSRIKNKQWVSTGFYDDDKKPKTHQEDFSNAEVFVPKLTIQQNKDLKMTFGEVYEQANVNGIAISFDNVYHHGNLTGYKGEKLEGTKTLDQQVLTMAQDARPTMRDDYHSTPGEANLFDYNSGVKVGSTPNPASNSSTEPAPGSSSSSN